MGARGRGEGRRRGPGQGRHAEATAGGRPHGHACGIWRGRALALRLAMRFLCKQIHRRLVFCFVAAAAVTLRHLLHLIVTTDAPRQAICCRLPRRGPLPPMTIMPSHSGSPPLAFSPPFLKASSILLRPRMISKLKP